MASDEVWLQHIRVLEQQCIDRVHELVAAVLATGKEFNVPPAGSAIAVYGLVESLDQAMYSWRHTAIKIERLIKRSYPNGKLPDDIVAIKAVFGILPENPGDEAKLVNPDIATNTTKPEVIPVNVDDPDWVNKLLQNLMGGGSDDTTH